MTTLPTICMGDINHAICPHCMCFMIERYEHPGWLGCVCGYRIKIIKKIVNPI